jgi:dihydropteroate synthase
VSNCPTDPAEITWRIAGTEFRLLPPPASPPLIMGIVNSTPDSFSDGGQFFAVDRAVAHALHLVEDGADIIDIGGESTRPGSDPISIEEELNRVLPVVEGLRNCSPVFISIDTSKAEVARRAIEAGAQIINDVTALRADAAMIDVVRSSDVGIIIMHMLGTPKTMQQDPRYQNVSQEVRAFLAERLAALEVAGVERQRIAIDPGIGFGKLFEHNLTLVRDIGCFRDLQRPICVGASRKGFIGDITARPRHRRAAGTAAVSLAAYQGGAHIMRVHDVAETRDVIAVTRAIELSKSVDQHHPKA